MTLTGNEIRKMRRERGLTQAEFAAMHNIHARTLRRWESDRREIWENGEEPVYSLPELNNNGVKNG